MINVDDDIGEPVSLNLEDVSLSNGIHFDAGNESEIDIMENTDSHDIKRELEDNLHKRADSVTSPTNQNNRSNRSKSDEESNHHRHSEKAPKTKQAKRMLDILNKGTGIVKTELPLPPSSTSTVDVASSSAKTPSSLSKNSVAQAVVKHLTKFLHDKRIKDKVSDLPSSNIGLRIFD